MAYWDSYYPPYVSAAEKRARALREAKKLEKAGRKLAPVVIEGKKIATTFWGKSWCENLEAYSDYASRLPRGRTYARNGSVLDLQIARTEITALVSGSELYSVEVKVKPLTAAHWKRLVEAAAGETMSMIDLLSGSFSERVMERFCQRGEGLFPEPHYISFRCSCPDSAGLCKHIAATLYGVGARLDASPELLFSLRGVDALDLVSAAAKQPSRKQASTGAKVIATADLADVFGLDMGGASEAEAVAVAPKRETKSKAKPTLAPKARKRRAKKKAQARV